MTSDDTTREKALRLLGKGLATYIEVAELAGESRQLVRHWAKRAGIDPAKARKALLARIWRGR